MILTALTVALEAPITWHAMAAAVITAGLTITHRIEKDSRP